MGHSKFAPSARARWSNCPASVRFAEQLDLPEQDTPYSLEGTLAHSIASDCLINDREPPEDPDIRAYVEFIRSIPGVMMAEKKLQDPENPLLHGTADAVIYSFGGRLTVADFKYGAGVIVPGDDNPQLEMYAVLAFAEGMNDVDEVAFVIHQPRVGDGLPHETVYPARVVAVWRDTILAEIEACEVSDAPFRAGDWCQFCPCKPACPELHRRTQLTTGMAAALPDPQQLTDGQIVWLLENSTRIADYLKSVEAFAIWRLQSGHEVPGFKLVQGLKNRAWIDERKALSELKKTGRTLNELAPRTLLSPAQAEKLVGTEVVASLVMRAPGAMRLVASTDKRPAARNVLEEFQVEKGT
jgi:hypothetical protein